MIWQIIIVIIAAAACAWIADYARLFKDYGSNYVFALGLILIAIGCFSGIFVWLLGWFFFIVSFYKNVKLGVD
jgi:hypothetical protein